MGRDSVLSAAWDEANQQMNLTAVTGTASLSGGNHDAAFIWDQVWDGTGIRVIRVG